RAECFRSVPIRNSRYLDWFAFRLAEHEPVGFIEEPNEDGILFVLIFALALARQRHTQDDCLLSSFDLSPFRPPARIGRDRSRLDTSHMALQQSQHLIAD